MDVAKYPEYQTRPVKVPSWETFDNRVQFIFLRIFAQRDGRLLEFGKELDLYTQEHRLGRVLWPFQYMYGAENLPELVDEIAKRNLFLFDVWGFVPMFDPEQVALGHVVPDRAMLDMFRDKLAERFLGTDIGEQDGRYVSGYAKVMCPAFSGRKQQFLNFSRHFRRMVDDQGGEISVLVSLTGGHFFAKEGRALLLGAETAQGLINGQLYYSFLRGAGKQYGVHWYGNASVYNRWGRKSYAVADADEWDNQLFSDKEVGPNAGTSLALLKRLMWVQIQYNSVLFGFDLSLVEGDDADDRIFAGKAGDEFSLPPLDWSRSGLSPVGKLQSDANEVIEARRHSGVHLAPAALMIDFYSGWMPPRHLYSNESYKVWGSLPYEEGDHLTHNLFNMLYPDYHDSGFYRDERGFLCPTPYGDITDTLMSDAGAWILNQYQLLVVAGKLEGNLAEVGGNLLRFVQNGGRLVLTGDNARRLGRGLTGIDILETKERFVGGTEVSVGEEAVEEPHAFELHRVQDMGDADVIAEIDGHPAAVRHLLGKGEVVVLLSPFGINSDSLVEGVIEVELNKPLAQPFVLCGHVQEILSDAFEAVTPFAVGGGGLGYAVSRRSPSQYEVLVYNNSTDPKPFSFETKLGEIKSVSEVSLGRDMRSELGYLPGAFKDEVLDLGTDSEELMAGLSVRLFELEIEEINMYELEPVAPPPPVKNRGISLNHLESSMEAVLQRPTFGQHFDWLKCSWRYYQQHDADFLKEEGAWLADRNVSQIADFSDGLNHYPDLTLLDNCPGQWERSLEMISQTFWKMEIAGCRHAVFTLTRTPEGPFEEEKVIQSFQKNIRTICDLAEKSGIGISIQNHPYRFYPQASDMLGFIRKVDHPSLRLCLNTCHLLCLENAQDGDVLLKALDTAGDQCDMVLLGSPLVDSFGRSYDSHLPVAGSRHSEAIRILVDRAADRLLVLDAGYPDENAEFEDVRFLFDYSRRSK
ncbi:MAG: TIM barrel protein [Verrucomicrobiota bacterium]